MLTICRAYVRFGVEKVSDVEIEAVATRAYWSVDEAASGLLEVESTGVKVEVNEGSLTVAGAVVASAGVVYTAITRYDDFWSGVERIRQHAHSVASFLRRRFREDPTLRSGVIVSSRISAGALDKIHRLHGDVEAGLLSGEDAVQEVLRTLRSSGDAIDLQTISGVEKAFGASHVGLERLESLELKAKADMAMIRSPGSAAESRKRPRRRLTINRPPGAAGPTLRFNRK